jgi:hypothetical protein
MDVPQPDQKSVELTVRCWLASDKDEIPRADIAAVKPVVDQLKECSHLQTILSPDTLLSTTLNDHNVSLNGWLRGIGNCRQRNASRLELQLSRESRSY